MSRELGVDYACYGEYKCDACKRTWTSVKAWRDFGQKCSKCSDMIKPDGLLVLHHYECKKCKTTWKNKAIKEGMPCKTCFELIMPVTRLEYMKTRIGMDSLFSDPNYDPRGGHREDLCEKCKKLGRNCSLIAASKPEVPSHSISALKNNALPVGFNQSRSPVAVVTPAPKGTHKVLPSSSNTTTALQKPLTVSSYMTTTRNNAPVDTYKRNERQEIYDNGEGYRYIRQQMQTSVLNAPTYVPEVSPAHYRRENRNPSPPPPRSNEGCAIL